MAPKRKAQKKGDRLKETLHEIYYDPAQPGSYGGVNQLQQVVNKLLPNTGREQVEDWPCTNQLGTTSSGDGW